MTTGISGYTENLSPSRPEENVNGTLEKITLFAKEWFYRIREASYVLPAKTLVQGLFIGAAMSVTAAIDVPLLPLWGIIAVGVAFASLLIIGPTVLIAQSRKATEDNEALANLVEAFTILASDNENTEKPRNIILNRCRPMNASHLARAILALKRMGIPIDEIREILHKDQENALHFVRLEGFLREAEIPTDEIPNILRRSLENAKHLARAVITLKYARILTATNYNQLIRGNGAYAEAIANHLIKMPLNNSSDIIYFENHFDTSNYIPPSLRPDLNRQFKEYKNKISNIRILTPAEYQEKFDVIVKSVSSSFRTATVLALHNTLPNDLMKCITDEFFVPNP